MKKLVIFILAVGIFAIGCKKKKEQQNLTSNNSEYHSYHNATKSHNMGQNCLSCHYNGGPGETVFNLGGTVYDTTFLSTLPNATLRLYTGPNGSGDLKYTIEVDGNGNFYTTSAIDFSTPLYPAITGPSVSQFMSSSITTGACASCHGNTTNKIFCY